MFWLTLQFLLFPGLIFAIVMGFISSWLVRKFIARMENRVGPPFYQPFYDFGKLLAKRRVYPQQANKFLMHYMPMFQVSVAILMAMFLPIYHYQGLLSFEGDLYFFLFLLAMHGATSFFVGWASRNTYALSGAGRAVITEISLEIPLGIALSGLAILTGSMRISTITETVMTSFIFYSNDTIKSVIAGIIIFIAWILLFVTVLYCTIGSLEFTPFSAAHAETEIVAGWNTELTGSDLAYTKLADYLDLFNMTAIIACIFLGGPYIPSALQNILSDYPVFLTYLLGFTIFLLKFLLVILLLSLIRVTSSRLRIDQIAHSLWTFFLPSAMISILLVLLAKAIGGT